MPQKPPYFAQRTPNIVIPPDLIVTISHTPATGQTGMKTSTPANPLYVAALLQDTALNIIKGVMKQSEGIVSANGEGLKDDNNAST